MPTDFNESNLPFSLLEPSELNLLKANLDIAYYQKGEHLIKAGEAPEGLFIVLKGRVRESEHKESGADEHVFVHYQDEDYFGAWSALKGKAIHNFIAEEETIAHILPTKTLLELVYSNPRFGDYFSRTLAAKTEIHEAHGEEQGMAEFMLAQVDGECMRDPLIVLEGTSIRDTTAMMREKHADCVLIRKGSRYGIVTGTDLLNAVVLKEQSLETDVSEIASYRLVTVEAGDYLFNALTLMTLQHIERVVVMKDHQLLGIIELTDVLSYFSTHSHVIGLRIQRAQTVEDLSRAAHGLNDLIKSLVAHGVKARFAMDLVAAMNERVMAKLFHLLVPEDILPHVCLVVMGSEGRGEQIMKTDQDNAVIMRDGLDWPDREPVLQKFTEVLIEFGYPKCPGDIMVSNPYWVQHLGDWTARMNEWASSAEGEALMNLAIAVDAKPVAGNPALFKAGRNWFLRQMHDNEVFFSHFAKASLEFATPLTLFGGIKSKEAGIDIKKGGVFPIVHGVRTLALQHRILETNTFKRIDALMEAGVLQKNQGRDLIEALSIFVQIRLQQQLVRMESADFQDAPNLIMIDHLDRLDKDLLREALHVVKEFKKHLALRYHLDR
ncbi:putative nucleotidyltransferase substrate binding domain-containing protein [Motiliproteus sp. SC1-56]|uniref:putative nucleotidyltransferase substrate binding domain-containing protein n=1 Tax=Motiliproteus sp. SC1-56 TaxID=2799565 RepID=UPI001A8C0502|nr:putative nucleotidyltransferase substrate binding domain-containing protein [Motiliproteus sp. SC1-56]